MKQKFLGDSYDIVKRFWHDSLADMGHLWADPRFVHGIEQDYAHLTLIKILDPDNRPSEPYGVLFDPHTGIPLPADARIEVSASHAPLEYIVKRYKEWRPIYMICFDQSFHRRHELKKHDQMEKKVSALRDQDIHSFYYKSHASFLFMAGTVEMRDKVYNRLVSLGIPGMRLKRWD